MSLKSNKVLVDKFFVKEILTPYWMPFVKESHIFQEEDHITLQSQLGADRLWYCESTGHMNAVELNLAFNQMMYVSIGQSIILGWIKNLREFDKDYFMKKYWPDFLITKIESKFKAPLDVRSFCGTLRIQKVKPLMKHLCFELDLTLKPGEEGFPVPGKLTHAYSKMSLVIKDYRELPS